MEFQLKVLLLAAAFVYVIRGGLLIHRMAVYDLPVCTIVSTDLVEAFENDHGPSIVSTVEVQAGGATEKDVVTVRHAYVDGALTGVPFRCIVVKSNGRAAILAETEAGLLERDPENMWIYAGAACFHLLTSLLFCVCAFKKPDGVIERQPKVDQQTPPPPPITAKKTNGDSPPPLMDLSPSDGNILFPIDEDQI